MQLHDLADKLVKEAEAQIAAARAATQKAIDAASAERATLNAALEDERHQRTNLEKQLKEQSAAQAFADAARREAEAARDKEAAAREKEAAARQKEVAAREKAEAARDKAEAARVKADSAREQEAAARAAVERELAAEREAADEREQAHARALKEAEAGVAEQLRAERARVSKSALQPLDHLRGAFERFRTAATIDDVLQILLESMATEFSRVAVFDVDGQRLAVGRHSGFEDHDLSKVVVPLTTQSPLTKAVKDGKVQGLTARELSESTRTLLGGKPTFVLVLPVPIRGEVRAVVYADDSGDRPDSTPERRVRFAEILLWHTVPLLTRLALEEEALAEFRDYAASIVNDLESVYVADAAKHKSPELRKRLQLNLQYARRRFNERMQGEGEAAARLLDEQLAAALERKGETPFGKDLAAVAS